MGCNSTSNQSAATIGRPKPKNPDVKTSEVDAIESALGVPVMVGTVTFGSPFVGAGCCASDSHALVGSGSTGPELNRIEDALGLI